jgi:hypothetical protein
VPEFLIANPFKLNGEIKRQGLITLTAEEAEPLVISGSLVPLVDGIELDDDDQLFTLDELTGDLTPVTASELQGLVVDSVAAGKRVFIVADGRSVERLGKSFTERQFMLLAPDEAAPLLESGDLITFEQLAEIMQQAELAEEARLAEEQRKAEEARLAEDQRKAEEARLAEEQRKAEEARLAEEQRQAEAARLAAEQKDNKKKAKGDAAQS